MNTRRYTYIVATRRNFFFFFFPHCFHSSFLWAFFFEEADGFQRNNIENRTEPASSIVWKVNIFARELPRTRGRCDFSFRFNNRTVVDCTVVIEERHTNEIDVTRYERTTVFYVLLKCRRRRFLRYCFVTTEHDCEFL